MLLAPLVDAASAACVAYVVVMVFPLASAVALANGVEPICATSCAALWPLVAFTEAWSDGQEAAPLVAFKAVPATSQ